jgi:CRP-like cAMP-binding protein
MIPTVERILFLNQIPLFEGFSVDELWQVAQALDEMHYDPGEMLVEEGKPGHALHLIVSGEVVGSFSGKEFVKFREKTVLGDVAVLDGMPYAITASAVDEVVTIKIEREKLDDILNANPGAARGIIRSLCGKVRFLVEQQLEPAKDKPRDTKGDIPLLKL